MDARPAFSGFPNEALQFLDGLAANNNRDWFKAHEQDYRTYVLAPGQAFVITLGERLKSISNGISYDPQTNGSGSIMRIYRDIRFSKDKSPYNTHLRVSFWEGPAKKTENPGYYFTMDAHEGRLYGGMYRFSKELLETYRQAVLDPILGKELEETVQALKEKGTYQVGGNTYKRVPSGYPPEHPRAHFLLHTGLHATSPRIDAKTLTAPALVDVCYEYAQAMAPLHRWLVQLNSLPAV